MSNMSNLKLVLPITFLLVFVKCSSLKGAEVSEQEIVEALITATSSIQTIQAKYRTYFPSINAPGTIKGPGGLGLSSEFEWGWDRVTNKEYLYGKFGLQDEKKPYYQKSWMAYDGKKLRELNPDALQGKISTVGSTFQNWRGPLQLFGRDITFRPLRSLGDLIVGAKILKLKDSKPHITVLRKRFTEGKSSYKLTVWVNRNEGFTPDKIEVVRMDFKTISRRYEIDKKKEIQPGIWMPLRGRVTFYYVVTPKIFAGGLTLSDLKKLPKEEAITIVSKTKVVTKALGMGTQTFIVDPKSIVVNKPIPNEKFTFEFPPGTRYWDDFLQKTIEVPKQAPSFVIGQSGCHSSHKIRKLFFGRSLSAVPARLLPLRPALFWRTRR